MEVGALTERAAEKEGPALLFSKFKGFPGGFRVISNVFRTCKRTGPAMGISPDLSGIDYLHAWRKTRCVQTRTRSTSRRRPDFREPDGRARSRSLQISDSKWHDLDGGPYLGTGRCDHKRSDTGKINIGTYRVMVQDKNKVSVKMNMGKHGRLAERARDAGKPLPVAITLGQGPAVFLAAQMPLPPGRTV